MGVDSVRCAFVIVWFPSTKFISYSLLYICKLLSSSKDKSWAILVSIPATDSTWLSTTLAIVSTVWHTIASVGYP